MKNVLFFLIHFYFYYLTCSFIHSNIISNPFDISILLYLFFLLFHLESWVFVWEPVPRTLRDLHKLLPKNRKKLPSNSIKKILPLIKIITHRIMKNMSKRMKKIIYLLIRLMKMSKNLSNSKVKNLFIPMKIKVDNHKFSSSQRTNRQLLKYQRKNKRT